MLPTSLRTPRTLTRTTSALVAVAALSLTAACSGDDGGGTGDSTGASASASATADVTAQLVGAGCGPYTKAVPDGAGSVEGMAQDPLAVAASNNPILTTLTAAISGQLNPDVNLVDTLNNDEFTIFAPVDDAFNKLDKRMVNNLSKPKNAGRLTDILTYHVVNGRIAPDDIDGEHETVNGAPVTVTGSGDDITVNEGSDAAATVVCGGVQTSNATLYLIDTVLMPPRGGNG